MEPSPALGHILDDYEIVAPAGWVLNPELEAKVLELDLVELEYLVDELLIHQDSFLVVQVHLLFRQLKQLLALSSCLRSRGGICPRCDGCSHLLLFLDLAELFHQLQRELLVVEHVLLENELDLGLQGVFVLDQQVVEQDVYPRLEENHEVLRFDKLGIQVICPLQTQLLPQILDVIESDWVDGIGSLQRDADQRIELSYELVDDIHSCEWHRLGLRFLGHCFLLRVRLQFVALGLPELVQISLELLSGSSLLHAYLLDVIESLVGIIQSGRLLLYLLWGLA